MLWAPINFFASITFQRPNLFIAAVKLGTYAEGMMALTSNLAGRNLGMLLLGVWLILTGLLPLLDVRLSSTVTTGLAILAIAAGLLILLRR